MFHPRSPHLWNAAILVVSVSVALAADRLTAASAGPASAAGEGAATDLGGFVVPLTGDSLRPRFQVNVPVDPFAEARGGDEEGVAPRPDVSTVTSAARGPSLTAILIADERRVAVIDDATVTVGDVLRDGARVSSIQPDRVWVVEKSGRWRMLTLTTRGQ